MCRGCCCRTIVFGANNISSGDYATVSGGLSNNAGDSYSTIAGGASNTNNGYISFIGGGSNNNITNLRFHSVIGGGSNNTISGGTLSFIAGGSGNTITHSNAFVLGTDITTTQIDTTYVENLIASGDGLFGRVNAGSQLTVGVANGVGGTIRAYENNAQTNSGIFIEQDGVGDAKLSFELTGGVVFSLGIDNSVSDNLVLSRSATLGTANVFSVDNNLDTTFTGDVNGANTVTNETDIYAGTTKVSHMITLSQAEYNSISGSTDAGTMYIII
mgnify:FL=1